MSKKCTICCDRAKKACESEGNEEVPEHYCPKNHEGSSKSMEPLAAIELLKYIYSETNSYVRIIVMDDDSSTVANCKHAYKDKIAAGPMTANE